MRKSRMSGSARGLGEQSPLSTLPLFSIIGKMDSVKQEIRVMLLRSSGDRRVSKRSKRSITRRIIK